MSKLELEEIFRVSGPNIFATINFPRKIPASKSFPRRTLARENSPRNILPRSDSTGK